MTGAGMDGMGEGSGREGGCQVENRWHVSLSQGAQLFGGKRIKGLII